MQLLNLAFDSTSTDLGGDDSVADRVVQDYSEFLREFQAIPGTIVDASQLPHDKGVIKDALVVCISRCRTPESIENLKRAYMMLPTWQDQVGETPLLVDFIGIDFEADPLKTADIIEKCCANMDRWKPVIMAERFTLMSELKKLLA